MEENKSLFQVYKSEEEKIDIIVRHVLLMLSRRIFIDKEEKKQPLLDLSDKPKMNIAEGVFTIKARNSENFAVKIFFHKITTSGKQSVISEFIREYADYKKIVIANDFNNKIADFAVKHGIQLFKESSMLEDVISYKDQPIFELLSPAEMKLVRSEYNTTNYTLNKTPRTDITVKYFGLKKSDIYRVKRYSPTSGYVPAYRIVM